MKKTRFLTSVLTGIICATITVMIILAYTGPTANPPSGDVLPPVRLQSSTPGDQQTGNINISGTGLFADNVGIGTTEPTGKLHVGSGDVKFDGSDLYLNGAGFRIRSPDASFGSLADDVANVRFLAWGDDVSDSGAKMVIKSGGSVGIGTTSPETHLHIQGTGNQFIFLKSTDGNQATLIMEEYGGAKFRLAAGRTSGKFTVGTDGTDGLLTIESGGNVGIGTTEPQAKLDIVGNTLIQNTAAYSILDIKGLGDTNHYSGIGLGRTTDNKQWIIDYRNSTEGNNDLVIGYNDSGATGWHTWMLIDDSTGNVGIGTTSPGSSLEVHGNGGADDPPLRLRNTNASAGNYWKVGPDGNNNFIVYTQSNEGVWMSPGSTSWSAGSDERLKQNIQPISILDRLTDYRAVSFVYTASGRRDLGVIAQELQSIFPELVSANANGYLGVTYDRLGALALQGVKELEERTHGLEISEQGDLAIIGNVGIGTTSPNYKLEVIGAFRASGGCTCSDILFEKDKKLLWRMFEDENGLYLENVNTGKVYRFVLQEVE